MKRVGLYLLLLFVSSGAGAHHAVTVAYDTNNLTSVEGQVTNVFWRNPHIVVTIERTLENGDVEEWRAESGSTNSLERIGVGRDIIAVGDTVSLLGAPSRLGLTRMAAYTMTLASGREIPLWPQRAVELGRAVTRRPSRRLLQMQASEMLVESSASGAALVGLCSSTCPIRLRQSPPEKAGIRWWTIQR